MGRLGVVLALMLGVLLVPLAAACQAPGAPAGPKLKLLAGSTSSGSSWYMYQVAEAKFLNGAVPEVEITVAETGGAVENYDRYSRQEMHLGLTTAGTAYQAYKGLDKWKDKPLSDLRWLWISLVGSRVAFVTEASGVKSLAELEGKKFHPGGRGTSTEKDFEDHMKILGIKPSYYRAGVDDAINAIKSREIIGYHKAQPFATTLDASTMDLIVFVPIRPVGYTDEQIKKIAAERPWDMWTTVKAGELHKDWPEFKTGVTVSGTGTMKDLIPNEVAYKMAKAMNERGADEIGAGLKFMAGWKYAEKTVEMANIPIHAGALKYYRELGLKFQEHQIPPEAK